VPGNQKRFFPFEKNDMGASYKSVVLKSPSLMSCLKKWVSNGPVGGWVGGWDCDIIDNIQNLILATWNIWIFMKSGDE